MTTALRIAVVANAIASMSVAGVTIKDKDQIVGSWLETPNVLYPRPENWITDFSIANMTFERGAEAKINVSYTLNYRFLGVKSGDLSVFPVAYSDLVDKLVLILNAAIALDDPLLNGGTDDYGVDLQVGPVAIGPRADPAGNTYFGADIALLIVEMQN